MNPFFFENECFVCLDLSYILYSYFFFLCLCDVKKWQRYVQPHYPFPFIFILSFIFLNTKTQKMWWVLQELIWRWRRNPEAWQVLFEWLLSLPVIKEIIIGYKKKSKKIFSRFSPVSMMLSSIRCKCNWSGPNSDLKKVSYFFLGQRIAWNICWVGYNIKHCILKAVTKMDAFFHPFHGNK